MYLHRSLFLQDKVHNNCRETLVYCLYNQVLMVLDKMITFYNISPCQVLYWDAILHHQFNQRWGKNVYIFKCCAYSNKSKKLSDPIRLFSVSSDACMRDIRPKKTGHRYRDKLRKVLPFLPCYLACACCDGHASDLLRLKAGGLDPQACGGHVCYYETAVYNTGLQRWW